MFNSKGLAILKEFEGCKLTVYKDLVGYLTVGYGQRTNLPEGTIITQDEADKLLEKSVELTSQGVKACVKVPLNENQFSALVCLAYNIGISALQESTLVRLLNASDYIGASRQFVRWDKAGGKDIPGLLRRRLTEKALFLI